METRERSRQRFHQRFFHAIQARRDAYARLEHERAQSGKDAKFFGLVAIGFFVAGKILVIVSGHFAYAGRGFSPLEVMSIVLYSASCVLGFWAFMKYALSDPKSV